MNIVGRSERYVYLKTGVEPTLFAQYLEKFGGNHHRALQHLRIRLHALMAGVVGCALPESERKRVL